jgi:energy-coupling factor transporter ATP-binding protein EcfA2
VELDAFDFLAVVRAKIKLMQIDESFLSRGVNEGFSGGEKKRNEILQMLVLEPKLALLDETDSGLDIDALKVVANGINSLRAAQRAIVLVTHYQRLLDHVVPDFVHVLARGRIARSGDRTLALELERAAMTGSASRRPEIPAMAHAQLRSATLDRILHDFEAVAARLPDALCRAMRARAAQALSVWAGPGRAMNSGATPICAPSRRSGLWPAVSSPRRRRRHRRAIRCRLPELPPPLPGFERLIFVDGVRHRPVHRPQCRPPLSPIRGEDWPAGTAPGAAVRHVRQRCARCASAARPRSKCCSSPAKRPPAPRCYPRLQVHPRAGSELKLVERHLGSHRLRRHWCAPTSGSDGPRRTA